MDKKYLLISLNDEKAKIIAEIIANKTSNKIIDFLAEQKEASENDIAQALNLPLNTIEYNIKKMTRAGLVEETKNFFWSRKGRKIKMYKFSNKSIIISPKTNMTQKKFDISSEIKSILPVAFLAGIFSIAIKFYFNNKNAFSDKEDLLIQQAQNEVAAFAATEATSKMAEETASIINTGDYWLWFLAGAVFVIVMFIIKLALYDRSFVKK